jgi:hypothetical protein
VLPDVPSFDELIAAIVATRERTNRLLRLKLSQTDQKALRESLEDLSAAERLLESLDAADKPHILRAANVYINVAQRRVDGVVSAIDAG